MLPCAHIAIGYFTARLLLYSFSKDESENASLQADLIIVLGSLMSDIVDKALYLTGITWSSRSFGHTALFCVFSSTTLWVAMRVLGQRFAGPHALLHFACVASHLAADCCFGFVPVFWPLSSFRHPSMVHTSNTKQVLRGLDVFGLVYVWLCTDVPGRVGFALSAAVTTIFFAISLFLRLKTLKAFLQSLFRGAPQGTPK